MIKLNTYITEAWSGMKQHALKSDIEAWCEEMGIKNYTINSKGEIYVDGGVNLRSKNFKVLPYKFGEVSGYFDIGNNPNLMSLKNCPDYVNASFYIDSCTQLDSLKGCPAKVEGLFYCDKCKREFTQEEVMSLCKVKKANIRV